MLRMKRIIAGIGILAVIFAYSGMALASEGAGITPDEALARLMEGNKRFAEGKQAQKDIGDNRRGELVKGQHPFAVILSCSDSRVPPEHIFDQGLGDIFVVRVAGNVADPIELGSVEYAVEHLGSPLILVLGHQMCGAVKATVEGGKPEGNIGSIVKKIEPAVKKARAKVKEKDKVLDAAILENVKNTALALTQKSAVIKHLLEEKKIKITAGVYNMTTGRVEIIEAKAEEKGHAMSHEHAHAHSDAAEHHHEGH